MSVGLYMDVHVPRALTENLRARGIEVLTAQEDDRRTLDDDALMDRATFLGLILFSYDRDMLTQASERQRQGKHFSGLIHVPAKKLTIGECVRNLEVLAKAGCDEDFAGRVEFLPL